MTYFSEVAITLSGAAFRKLLSETSLIEDPHTRTGVAELLAKANIYRQKQDNTVLLYWGCTLWITQTECSLPEVRWIEELLNELPAKEYFLVKIEGESRISTAGLLRSGFDTMPVAIISKRINANCERLTGIVVPEVEKGEMKRAG